MKPKIAVAKSQAAAKAPAKTQTQAAAKTPAKTKIKTSVKAAAAPKTKAKIEVTASQKNKAAAKQPVTKTVVPKAVATKPVPAKAVPAKAMPAKAVPAKAAAAKVAPVKPVASAKAPTAMSPKAAAQAVLAARAKAQAGAAARAMPAAVHKPSSSRKMTAPSMPVLPAQPTMPRGAANNPKELALKAAEARRQQMLAAPKKPVYSRHGFKIGESIVYPAHGVGQIVGIEEQEIAGMSLELFVIQIEKDKLTLRVPTARLEAAGIRKLAEDNIVTRAMETLKGRARVKRTMWSRRAQEY
jgi:CarD family transcriptional regulator